MVRKPREKGYHFLVREMPPYWLIAGHCVNNVLKTHTLPCLTLLMVIVTIPLQSDSRVIQSLSLAFVACRNLGNLPNNKPKDSVSFLKLLCFPKYLSHGMDISCSASPRFFLGPGHPFASPVSLEFQGPSLEPPSYARSQHPCPLSFHILQEGKQFCRHPASALPGLALTQPPYGAHPRHPPACSPALAQFQRHWPFHRARELQQLRMRCSLLLECSFSQP